MSNREICDRNAVAVLLVVAVLAFAVFVALEYPLPEPIDGGAASGYNENPQR